MDYKPIRNKLKNFTFDSITIEILNLLKELENKKKLHLPFWHLLLLLKWNLIFSKKNYKAKEAKREDILKLLKKVENLQNSHNIFDPKYQKFKIHKAMTILAHQQFLYQNFAYWDTFVRQLIIFDELKSKYCIKSTFKKLTNLDLDIFIKILFTIYLTFFVANKENSSKIKFIYNGYLTNQICNLIIEIYGTDNLNSFLNLLSISENDIEEFIKNDKRSIKNFNLHPFEASIFTRKPFLFYSNKLIIPHKGVLNHNFNHFLYEFMKNNDENFTTELGIRLEKYVNLGLKEINIKYKTESEVKKEFKNIKNLVDYVVSDNILIEIKAIELKPYPSINPNDKILANEFRKNIVKAYAKQMIEVAKHLKSNNIFYGIIITYKKLFLGNSTDIWEQFLKTETLKIRNEEELKILPIENLFFIDIESWDKLVQIIKNRKIPISDILEKVKENDKNPKTKKFSFHMHLEDDFKFERYDLTYLTKSYNRLN